jgi:hypothetical protein
MKRQSFVIAFALALFATGIAAAAEEQSSAAVGASSSSSASASAGRSEALQEVTVRAHRIELEKRVSKFVNQIAEQQNLDEGLARWHRLVCPLVSGLPREDGEFILGRVSEIARDAGVKLGNEQCKPNLYILVTPQPAALLKEMEKRNRDFTFGRYALPDPVDEFIASPRPVRVWQVTDFETSEGLPMLAVQGRCPTIDGMIPRCNPHAQGNPARFDTVWTVLRVFVVVDRSRLRATSRGQLADYVAMVGLADIKPGAHLGDAPTILKLFDGEPQAAPAAMSDWDAAFLKSLYATDSSSKQQRNQMARQMVGEIAPRCTTRDSEWPVFIF